MTDTEYHDWLLDVTRTPYRALLIEVDHADGMVCLGSVPWLSDQHIPYDDWLTELPVLEESLTDFVAVGDFEAINPVSATEWQHFNFRGHECRWLFGDTDWPRSEWRQIAATLVEDVQSAGGHIYRFNLTDRGYQLQNTINTEQTLTKTVENMVGWLASHGELGSISLLHFDDQQKNARVRLRLTEETTYNTALAEVATAVNAWHRVNQSGQVELITRSSAEPSVLLTEDDITVNSVQQSGVLSALQRVTVGYDQPESGDEKTVTATTGANTGVLDEDYHLSTVLVDKADAEVLLDALKTYRSTEHEIWSLEVFDVANLLQVGQSVRIEHAELTVDALNQRIKRSPLSDFSVLEVEV